MTAVHCELICFSSFSGGPCQGPESHDLQGISLQKVESTSPEHTSPALRNLRLQRSREPACHPCLTPFRRLRVLTAQTAPDWWVHIQLTLYLLLDPSGHGAHPSVAWLQRTTTGSKHSAANTRQTSVGAGCWDSGSSFYMAGSKVPPSASTPSSCTITAEQPKVRARSGSSCCPSSSNTLEAVELPRSSLHDAPYKKTSPC